MKKTKADEWKETGGRWCARHDDESQCEGDRKLVVIDGTHYIYCARARSELRSQRRSRTLAFKDANMSLFP